MAKIISFPKQSEDEYDEAFLEAEREIESRFGMPLSQYLRFDGDMADRNKKVHRVLQKETLQLRTRLTYEGDE